MQSEKCYKVLDSNFMDKKEMEIPFRIGYAYQREWMLASVCNGFRYVKKLEDLTAVFDFGMGKNKSFKVFECRHGREFQENKVFASDEIQLTREVTSDEIHEYALANLERLKCDHAVFLIKAGCNHLEFMKDPDPEIRALVAKYGSEEVRKCLLTDKNWRVRQQVAINGTFAELMKLRKDPSRLVRETVARAGNRRVNEALLKDKCWQVRAAIAETGDSWGINFLSGDPDWRVRMAVITYANEEQLIRLSADGNAAVRRNAEQRLSRLKEGEAA